MRQFDFYEFVGVIVPGAVFLTGVALAWPDAAESNRLLDLSVGGLGLGVVLAYGAGHLVQALGNLIEKGWWGAWGGMPSDWPRSGKRPLLAPQQVPVLEERVRGLLGQPDFRLGATLKTREWYAIVRQIYAVVQRAGAAGRVDVFNGNYGLCRGLAAGLVALIPALALIDWPGWGVSLLLLAGAGVALYRMHRFGVHYGRELFVQFLATPAGQKEAANA
jgi:hypothetical protein